MEAYWCMDGGGMPNPHRERMQQGGSFIDNPCAQDTVNVYVHGMPWPTVP